MKSIFHHFKGLSFKQIKQYFLKVESATLSCDAELFLFCDVSSAENFTKDEVPSDKSFMWVRENNDTRIEPWPSSINFFPIQMFSHSE